MSGSQPAIRWPCCSKLAFGGEFKLVLTGFRHFAFVEPIDNGLRSTPANTGDFCLGAVVGK